MPAQPAASKSPIRVILVEKKEPAAAEAADEEAEGGVSPQTGLVVGLVVVVGMVFATLATVVFFLLGFTLALLHRELSRPQRSLEEYAGLVPERVGQLFQRFNHPDGRLILAVLLLAVAVFLVPSIVLGLAGAAALVTALYLLDYLDRPAAGALDWMKTCEDVWAGRLRAWFNPDRCHLLAVLSLFPAVCYLAAVFLPKRLAPALYYRVGLAGGITVALLVSMGLRMRREAQPTPLTALALAARTLLVSTVLLMLIIGCTTIELTRQMKIPFFTEGIEWNGIWLAVLPVGILCLWRRSYIAKQNDRDSGNEQDTWRFSSLSAVTAVVSAFLFWRALQLQARGWGEAGSTALFAMMLAGWFALAKLLLSLVRTGPEGKVPEWTMVHLSTMACLILCFFMVYFGGPWGLAAAIFSAIMVWTEAARLSKGYREPAVDEIQRP